MDSNLSKGIKLAFITAIVSGFAIFINKFAVGSITPPLAFTAVKNTGVGLIIIGWLLISNKWRLALRLDKKERLYLAGIAIIGGALPFYMFFTGLSMIPAINAALLHKTLVIWVALLAMFFLKEKLTPGKIAAVLILFLSNFLIGGFKGLTYSLGELMVLGATILWAIETIIAKRALKTIDPDVLTTARMAGGAVILLGATAVTSPNSLVAIASLKQEQIFWLLATMSTLVMYVASWYRALKYAPATTVAGVLVGSTIITNLLSAFFITHTLNGKFVIQALVILIGLWLMYKATLKAQQKDQAVL